MLKTIIKLDRLSYPRNFCKCKSKQYKLLPKKPKRKWFVSSIILFRICEYPEQPSMGTSHNLQSFFLELCDSITTNNTFFFCAILGCSTNMTKKLPIFFFSDYTKGFIRHFCSIYFSRLKCKQKKTMSSVF